MASTTTTTMAPESTDNISLSSSNPKVPEVPYLSNTASIDEIVAAIKVAGGCVIKNAVETTVLDTIEKDVRPLLLGDSEWVGTFFPAETRRAYAMLDVSETYAKEIVMHPIYQAVAAKFLTMKHWFWEGTNKQWAVSKPQLSNTIVFSIGAGAAPQPLHRDDSIHQRIPRAADVYPEINGRPRDASVGFFVAAKKATKQNGATRFIPGSHLWAHEQVPDESLCQYAEMEKGDAFLMLASCLHAGSANHTTNEERLIFSSFMTRGIFRQEENQYLAVSRGNIKKLPVDIQKMAGYSLSEPFLGWVQSTDPRVVLDPSVAGNKDMYSGAEEPADA